MKRAFILLAFVALPLHAQTGFNKQEFQTRRDKLFEQIPGGMAVIFSCTTSPTDDASRQSPDFWYLTGIDAPDAVLVMVEPTKKAYVFSPKKDFFEIFIGGPGLQEDTEARDKYGVQPVDIKNFLQYVGKWAEDVKTLYLPLTPMDNRDFSRGEVASAEAKAVQHPVYGRTSDRRETVKRIMEWLPQLAVADVNPILDKMRWVKTPYEIERMRKSGKIGAEGVKQAMKGTKPGMYEYEIAAAARYIFNKNGASDAFPPIVASGPNTIIIHYFRNNRKMEAGDVVLLDYGSDYDHYESDITRSWPVSGKFSADEEKMYRCILEARNVIFAAMKPGITVNRMKAIGDSIYTKNGFKKEYDAWGQYVGHYIGISVHGVTPYDDDKSMEPGVCFNLEPVIENREKKIHMRLEDTILITEKGAENLTAGVPAEVEEVYKLVKEKGISY